MMHRIERKFDPTVSTLGQGTDGRGDPKAICPYDAPNARRCWSHRKPGLYINLLVVCV